jgi:hypothetical protein
MRRLLVLLALTVLGTAIVVSAAEKGEKAEKQMMMPAPDGKTLWTYITEVNPYQGWAIWPGYMELAEGQSPHGAWLRVYANGVAMKAAREGKDMMPDGAIIVKDNYAEDKKTLAAITPMYRVKGYNPEGGDWFWVKYGPDGEVMAEGKVKGCIDCHKAADDWRFVSYPKGKMKK